MALPAAKGRISGLSGGSTTINELDEKDDEEAEETCVFSLDPGPRAQGRSRASSESGGGLGGVFGNGDANDYDDEDDDELVSGGKLLKYDLAQLGAEMDDLDLNNDVPDKTNLEFVDDASVGVRGRMMCNDVVLGTSPSLMSALNQVAAEASSHRRHRSGTM